MLLNLLPLLVASAVLAVPAPQNVVDNNAPSTLELDLEQADTAVARNQILAANGGNASFAFDFANPPQGVPIVSAAGNVTLADVATAPFLTGLDASLAVFHVEPCGLILPHLHPRADEFVIVTEGQIFTQFIAESGATLVTNTLNQFGATIFPKGSIHLEYNPTCYPATFIGAFNANDPGTSFVAANFLSLEDNLVIADLGGDSIVSGSDLESIRAHIPPPVAVGVAQCLSTCKIQPYAKRSLKEVFARK
jgi:hypothetical protein